MILGRWSLGPVVFRLARRECLGYGALVAWTPLITEITRATRGMVIGMLVV